MIQKGKDWNFTKSQIKIFEEYQKHQRSKRQQPWNQQGQKHSWLALQILGLAHFHCLSLKSVDSHNTEPPTFGVFLDSWKFMFYESNGILSIKEKEEEKTYDVNLTQMRWENILPHEKTTTSFLKINKILKSDSLHCLDPAAHN